MSIEMSGGLVSIEDGNKASEEYAPARKVKVELRFDIPEGGNYHEYLDAASVAADTKVNELLGKSDKKPAKEPATATAPVAEKPAASTHKKKDEAVKQPAKEAVVDASPAGSDKAALEAAAGLKPSEPVQSDIEDNIDDLLGNAAPVPITDAELAKAAQNKNAQMKASDPNFSVKIRALVVEYAGQPPKKITDVPVAKRQEFLDKLRDLK